MSDVGHVHGIGSRWQVWQPVLDRLVEHGEVIAVDLPGFGASPAHGATSVSALIDRIVDFLAEQGLRHAHLAGNSMGGGIALELGARGLARSVTAFSPIGFWSTPGSLWCRTALGALRSLGGRIRPVAPALLGNPVGRTVLLGLVVGKPTASDPAIALADVDALLAATGWQQARASFAAYRFTDPDGLAEVPTTIAWGRRDLLLTYATQSRRARAVLPDARHVTLAGCGHIPFQDDPVRCAEILLDQLIGR